MDIEILLTLLDEHNENILAAINKFMPKKVIYIKEKDNENPYNEIEIYHNKNYKNIELESILINTGDAEKFHSIISNLPKDKLLINITGGEKINSLILLREAILNNIKAIYIDINNKIDYTFNEKNISIDKESFKDIYIEDVFNITGSEFIMDSTNLSKKEDIIVLTKKIYENLDLWYKYKQELYDNNIFNHNCDNNKKIMINKNLVNKEEIDILMKSLDYIKSLNDIEYKIIGEKIELTILNDYLKGFIFKSGTWLEVLTNMVIREIQEIDEVKSGVVFLWNNGNKKVKNELDVIAINDYILICISCKDSDKYDEFALNELEVYSKKLGGDNVKKILVATKEPNKVCIIERAKAMGINLVILNKNITKFKNQLIEIISSN